MRLRIGEGVKIAFFTFTFSFFIGLTSCKTTHTASHTAKPKATATTSSSSKKYAKLGIEADKNSNLKLYDEVIDWWGTPYKYGGEDKSGADCSGFVQVVFSKVYNKKVPRTTKQQYEACKKIGRNNLKEGDLVFFETGGKGISHVGIYLKDDRFAHASSSKGVMVNSLDEEYYDKHYKGGGRIE